MLALILAAGDEASLGVDGDELAVAPDAGCLLVKLSGLVDGVTDGFEFVGGGAGETLFKVEAVWQVLVVEAGGVGGLLDGEAVVEDADEVVGDGGDDGGAAWGAEDEEEFAVAEDHGGGHGGEGPLAGSDGVGRALDEAEHVGDADL